MKKPVQRPLSKRQIPQERRGATLIWMAMSMMMFIGFLGVSIDFGYVYFSTHQLHNAADASALAGARVVGGPIEEVYEEARRVASENWVAGERLALDDEDIIIGHFDTETGVFTPTTGANRNAVRINAKRIGEDSIPLFFGNIFNVEGANVTRMATAMIASDKGIAIHTTGEAGCSGGGGGGGGGEGGIHLVGNAKLIANDGEVWVNSQTGCGVCATGNAHTLEAQIINTDGAGVCASNYTGPVNDEAGPWADPLGCPPGGCPSGSPIYCCLPPPPTGTPQTVPSGSPVVLQPGYYENGISVQGQQVFLQPGIYVLGGNGLDIHSNGMIHGEGVTIYLEGDAGLKVHANASASLSPPDADVHTFPGADLYENVTIFQARDNSTKGELGGGPSVQIDGLVYMPGAELQLIGTPGGGQTANMIISKKLSVTGNANILVNYNGIFPLPDNRVFLVE